MAIVRSLCGGCGVGCGIRVVTGDARNLSIEGDALHPANGGALCDRGRALLDAFSLDGRLLYPFVDGRRVGWDRAIAQVARRFSAILKEHGPGSIALHVGGGLLTEDYYVANKLMKGFLGSAHIHAPCRGKASEAQLSAFGEDVMPGTYEDIDRADLILILGTGVTAHPILLDRVQRSRGNGTRIIMIGEVGDGAKLDADVHLSIRRGSAARLLNGLLLHGHDRGSHDAEFLEKAVAVPDRFWDKLRPGHDIWSVTRACGLPAAQIRAFYEIWAVTNRCVTLCGDHDAGVARAVMNLHLASGRIGKPGATPVAMTASANAMGARETGCIASHLAAHWDFAPDALAKIRRFWDARNLAEQPGLDGEALLRAMHDGRIKALWSIGADEESEFWLEQARAKVPLTLRSTHRLSETADGWDILLPSATWIEKDGTVTGMDRLISRQRRLFSLPGEAKPDWWMLTKVAQAMGWADAFHYEGAADIYREHARLTAYGNEGARLLDLRRYASISNPAYDELTPWRWGEVPFDDGRFPTPDGRARLIPV